MGKRLIIALIFMIQLPILITLVLEFVFIEFFLVAPIYWFITGKDGIEFIYEYGLLIRYSELMCNLIGKIK